MHILPPNLKVSVVILCFNNYPDILLAIDSAFCQTYPPTEIIVVDNGSSDDTMGNVLFRYGDSIRYIQNDPGYDGSGYNTGILSSSGDYIQLLDGDDLLAPNKIEAQLNIFQEFADTDIVYSDSRRFLSLPGCLYALEKPLPCDKDLLPNLCYSCGDIGLTIASIYGSDYEFWFRAASYGKTFRYAPGTFLFYRKRSGQITSQQLNMLQHQIDTLKTALSYVSDPILRKPLLNGLSKGYFWRAFYPSSNFTQHERINSLQLYRSFSPETLSLIRYYLSRILICLPGAPLFIWRVRSFVLAFRQLKLFVTANLLCMS